MNRWEWFGLIGCSTLSYGVGNAFIPNAGLISVCAVLLGSATLGVVIGKIASRP